jgi:hypothetical protein
VQLKVEKDLFAVLYQILGKGQAAATGELQTNFIEAHAIAERGHEGLGFPACREIERNDKFFAGSGRLLLGSGRRPHHG